ncbi:hypothetical protein D9M69_714310 [compost metagenome]
MLGMQAALLRVASASANGERSASSVAPRLWLERFQMIPTASASSSTDAIENASTNCIIACSGSSPDLPSCAALMQNRITGSG